MDLEFRDILLGDKKIFDRFLPRLGEPRGSEYCFPLVFVENISGATQICDLGETAIVKTKWSNRRMFFPPMLKSAAKFIEAVTLIEQEALREGVPLEIRMVGEPQAKSLDTKKYLVTENFALSDYIYKADDLIHLVGKKFHSKRNYITRFYKKHENHTFREYSETADRDNIMRLLGKWNANTLHEKWALEDKLIARALDHHRDLDLKIAVLYVAETLVAFSVNYVRNSEIAFTFFEKADTDYIGSYQVINQRTAELFFGSTKFVNRQCDMGVDGLRKAKLSYKPAELLHKYTVQHRN